MSELINILSELYTRFYKSTTEDFSQFAEVMEKKSLAGVVKGFSFLNISKDIPITGFVNGKAIDDSWKNISKVLDHNHKFNTELLKREKHIRTLIHGDPTLSNITTNFAGDIYLLDPIGARVLPSYSMGSDGLGRTHPVFDYSRVNLSVEHQCERWASEIVVSMEGSERNYLLSENSSLPTLKPFLDKIWPKEFSPTNQALMDLVYITTLSRIFPYKAKTKKKEAFYLLGLLNEKCKRYIDLYM